MHTLRAILSPILAGSSNTISSLVDWIFELEGCYQSHPQRSLFSPILVLLNVNKSFQIWDQFNLVNSTSDLSIPFLPTSISNWSMYLEYLLQGVHILIMIIMEIYLN